MKKLYLAYLRYINGSEWTHEDYKLLFTSYDKMMAYVNGSICGGDEIKLLNYEVIKVYEK